MTTLAEARDAVISLIDVAWKAAPASSSIEMQYTNVQADKPNSSVPVASAVSWARTTVQVLAASQSTQGKRRFRTIGSVTVQIFTPFGDGHTLGDTLSAIVLATLRGHVGSVDGIDFSDVTPVEIGVDGPWFNINVTAEFTFQEAA